MKTIGTLLFTLVVTLITSTVFASGNLKVNFASENVESTAVEISNVKSSHFEVEFRNSYGDKFYSYKTVSPTSLLKKKYDLSKLEDGVYYYKVKMDNETIVKNFEMKNGEISVIEIRKTIEPVFVQKDGILKFTHLNPQNEDVKLYVYDSSNTLLTKSKLGSDFAIHKVVDLSKLERGTYEVVIEDKVDFHQYLVSIE